MRKKLGDSLDWIVSHTFSVDFASAQRLIREGKVFVDGKKISSPRQIEATRKTIISVNDEIRKFCRFHHVLLHKPVNTLTTHKAEIAKRQTVYELLAASPLFRADLRAVGRLDYTTSGLLLFTNDMDLLQRMTHPDYHLPKCYECDLEKPCTPLDAQLFKIGFRLASHRRSNEVDVTQPATLETEPGSLKAKVTIHEGMHHQIKRMFHAVQNEVVGLKRLSMGPLSLEEALLPGSLRPLAWDEQDALYRAVRLQPPP